MKTARVIGMAWLLATIAGCSKDYALAPDDAGGDHPTHPTTGGGGAGGTTAPDAQPAMDAAAGGTVDATFDLTFDLSSADATDARPAGPDADGAATDATHDATSDLPPGDGHSDASEGDGAHDAGADLPADGGPDGAPADGGEPDGDGGTPDGPVDGDGGPVALVLSIPTIRDPAAANHPPSGTMVQTSGVVTAVKAAGPTHTFFLQAANVTRFAGVYIYVGSTGVTNLAPGAVVQVIGLLSTYRGIDQIDTTVGSFSITGVSTVPAPIDVAPADIATGGAKSAELQSMLVHLNKTVVAGTATVGTDFVVTDNLIITSFIANGTGASPFPATVGQSFTSLTGALYTFGSVGTPDFKLAPRSSADIVSP